MKIVQLYSKSFLDFDINIEYKDYLAKSKTGALLECGLIISTLFNFCQYGRLLIQIYTLEKNVANHLA